MKPSLVFMMRLSGSVKFFCALESLGAGAVRYSFTVTDFHRPPFAGLPAHPSTPSSTKTSEAIVAPVPRAVVWPRRRRKSRRDVDRKVIGKAVRLGVLIGT